MEEANDLLRSLDEGICRLEAHLQSYGYQAPEAYRPVHRPDLPSPRRAAAAVITEPARS